MSSRWKITTISCRIDLGAIEPVSNFMIFRPLYKFYVYYYQREKMPVSHSKVSDSEV